MLFVTVYWPPTITAAGVALLQRAAAKFVFHCIENPSALVGHLKTTFVPYLVALRSGPPVVNLV